MARRKRQGQPTSATFGPVLGVKDEDGATDPQFAQSMTNVVFSDAGPVGGVVSRPGLTKHGNLTITGSAEGVVEHVASDGTRIKFVFTDAGKVYRWAWTSTSAGVSTFTDVTPVGVAIDDRVSCVSFADCLIVSDGQNRPWKATNLTSTPITGTYLTGVPAACYGPPAVYYAKLFFIKANERNTIIWSEENDPDTGYEAGGYNNAWTLSQTSNEPLVAIRATNEALYYWRSHSMGKVTGAVNDEFQTAGVHDSLSQTVGAADGWAVAEAGGSFYFVDAETRLHAWTPDRGLVELWRDITTETYSNPVTTIADPVLACYSPHDRAVIVSLAAGPLNRRDTVLVVSTDTQRGLGVWTGGPTYYDAMGVVTDPLGIPRLVVLNGTSGRGLWAQESTAAGLTRATDYDGTTTTYPDCSIVAPMLGYDVRLASDWNLLTVVGASTQTVRLDYETPRGSYGTAQSVTMTGEGKATVGINAQSARWIRPRVRTPAVPTAAFSFVAAVVSGVPVTEAPGVA